MTIRSISIWRPARCWRPIVQRLIWEQLRPLAEIAAVDFITASMVPKPSSLVSVLPGRRECWAAKPWCAALSLSLPTWKARAPTCACRSTRPSRQAETLVQYKGVALPTTTTDQGLAPVGSASDPFAGALIRVWDPNVQPALTDQWNLTIQHQLANTATLQVGYVGQHGTHLMVPMPYLQRQLLPNTCLRHASLHRRPAFSCPAILPFNPTSRRFRARLRWAA